MPTLQEKINLLPPEAKQEVIDFIDFILDKYQKEEKLSWLKLSEKAIDKIWDNTEDDVYNELLKR